MPKMPNRSENLSASGERNRKSRGVSVTRGKSNPITCIPEPDSEWHKVATMLWDSTLASGGASYFEESDVAVLYFLCDQVNYLYRTTTKGEPRNRSPELIKAILTGLGNLLATEGDRRKLHIELSRAPDDDEDFLADLKDLLAEGDE